MIRVYGSELQPYLRPKFLNLRVLSLEFIRQHLNSNHVNLFANKKKTYFKLNKEVGPFIVKDKSSFQEAWECLKEMGLDIIEAWHYDPHGVIITRRKKYGLLPYPHQSKPYIEKLADLARWEDVHNILQEQ
jgi:hypothetical protein